MRCFCTDFSPAWQKNADRNPRILIGQRDPSRGGFSLKSALDLRYPCAPHGHPTTYFYKITVRRSKYCLILKLKTGLNFWMTELFVLYIHSFSTIFVSFMRLYIRQANFTTTPRFEIVQFHFANFQGSIDKIPIWKKNANAYESCQWNCLSYVNMEKEDCFKSLTISSPARRSHGLLGMILIKSIMLLSLSIQSLKN